MARVDLTGEYVQASGFKARLGFSLRGIGVTARFQPSEPIGARRTTFGAIGKREPMPLHRPPLARVTGPRVGILVQLAPPSVVSQSSGSKAYPSSWLAKRNWVT